MKQDTSISPATLRAARAAALPAAPEDDLSIDLRGLASRLWRGRRTIALCMALGALVGALAVSQMVPQYKASSKVMFSLPGGSVTTLPQVVSGAAVNERTMLNEVEVLQSSSLIGRVVDALHLTDDPRFNPALRLPASGFLTLPPALREGLTNLGILSLPEPTPPPGAAQDRQVRAAAIASLARGLDFEPLPGTRIIRISHASTDPELSAKIVNTLTDQYMRAQIEAKLDATRTATAWLSERVEELRLRMQGAEEAVEAARSHQSVQSGQSLEITQQQLSALNGILTVARNATTTALATYERLRDAVAEGRDFGAISEFRASSLIQSYRAREDELLSQRTNLLASVPETHPSVQRIDMQLAEIAANVAAEAGSIVEAARSDWIVARAREERTEGEVRALEDLALEQSRAALQIRQLEREAEASRNLYANFLARLNETSEQEEVQTADARVLSPAEPPARPLSTRRTRTLLASVLFGLLAGIGLVLLLERLSDTFRSARELAEATGLPVLGALPMEGRRLQRIDVLRRFREAPRSALAEAVRNLRTSILFSNVDRPPQVVLFTSSVPREGKSTSALLVAMTSRQMGQSAIIVDCDLRLPALARMLDAADDAPGLLSLIEGTAQIDEAVFVDPETGLHVLMCKPSEPRSNVNAADILSSRKFDELIAALRARYDRVILDAPPTLAVTDARILAARSDAVVYAVRWDHTPRGAVLEGLRELQNVNAPLAGTVLAMIDEKKAARHAYDGGTYYRGRYRDYYAS